MIKNIGVHIKVKDFKKSTAFYETLGFKKVFEYGPDKEVKENYNGITYAAGECLLEIADGHVAVKPAVFQELITSSKISLMIKVTSIKHIIDICKKANIKIIVEPKHYHWGTIEVVVKDPDGTVLVFVCPYSKEEEKNVFAGEVLSVKPW